MKPFVLIESKKKNHLLKPCNTTSIDESEAMLPSKNRSASSRPDLKALSLSVSFNGWKMAYPKFKSWAGKMSSLHEPTWKKAGILEAVMASTTRIQKNTDLLLCVAEKWCPDTNTFVFPWGEATITLEDVMVLLGFSVLGLPYFATLEGTGEEILGELENEWRKIKRRKVRFVTQLLWMERFMDSGDELEHVAFLVLWLSYFVFPSRYYHIDETVFPIAVHLSRGTRIALAPAVLAHLYEELTLLKHFIGDFNITTFDDKLELSSLFKLVQVWTWERFRELRPKNPNSLRKGEPRLARWDDTRSNVKKILANPEMDSFEWRPYTKPVENWNFPQFYPEKAMWVPVDQNLDDEFISFARCIKVSELVGIDSVKHYSPSRVASQFGLLQDVPCLINRNNLSKEAAWDEYNKPIDDLTLYIPSRSAVPRLTPEFCDWWRKSSLEFQRSLRENRVVESAEPLTPRNIVGDDETSDSVPSGSKRRRKLLKRVCELDESNMGRYQMHVQSENDEEDDSLTIDQVMRLRKKKTALCASNENHSSDPPQVLFLSSVLQKLGQGFPEKLKRSRYLRTTTNLRSEMEKGKIVNHGGSASREVSLGEVFQKDFMKRKSEHLVDKQAGADDDVEGYVDFYDNITTAEMLRSREKRGGDASESFGERKSRLEADNSDSWSYQKLASENETVVAPREIEQKSEEKTGIEANENNSSESDPPLGAKVDVVQIVVSPLETRQNCDDEFDVKEIYAKKKKSMVGDGTKEAECLVDEDEEKQRSNEKVDDDNPDESSKQINLAVEEIVLTLEARMTKLEKNLAKVREWKSLERNQAINGVSS